jgi:hypothetical protein
MTNCYEIRGAIGSGQFVQGIDSTKSHFYVPTGSGIDRWTYPGFVQTVNWHSHAGGVQSLAVGSGGTVFHKANTGGHLWKIEEDGTGETDLGAITANDIVYSPHENVLYGVNGTTLYRITPAGTETSIGSYGSSFIVRPTIQRGGIIWFMSDFTTLYRLDPDASYSSETTSFGQLYVTPACPTGADGVYGDSHFYSEGIVATTFTCTGFFTQQATWSSDYGLILMSDGGSGTSNVYSLSCGARPPLRILQRSDDLRTGSPRINPTVATSQKSLRIYGPGSLA